MSGERSAEVREMSKHRLALATQRLFSTWR